MNMINYLTYFFFLATFSLVQSSDPCVSFNGQRVVGKKLSVTAIRIIRKVGLQLCLKHCQQQHSCLSVNYNRETLECELLNVGGNSSIPFVDYDNYIFEEVTADDKNRTLCGKTPCNSYSTCISTSSSKNFCIATECSESVPFLENGIIVSQTYSPPSVTYGCQENYIAVGQGNTTQCTPGGKWTPLSLICEDLGI
ncbi:uncharacterized protein LOC133204314 [Saccostrea echinata]|uniref:uncharacterized protein LOC133204314 n=1 Tax=Saccostrea echinata TaxID=191078 RepID=UPI002A8224D5|nr:uncharacterized protein LOC133204314 [Saccostrea echinata]